MQSFGTSLPEAQEPDSFDVLGVPVSVTNLENAARRVEGWAADGTGRYVCVRDVHGIMLAQKDDHFRQVHEAAAMVTPDGMPLVWLGKIAGLGVGRTSGPDLMDRLIKGRPDVRLKHYFYGGKPGVAEALAESFVQKYPGTEVVFAGAPPFRPLHDHEIDDLAQSITETKADVVWLGLSTPKQERLMSALTPRVRATVIGVGAAFDFHSGQVRRAPRWMQVSGLEWLHRLASEPRRLWRRYLVLAPRFVWLVVLSAAKSSFREEVEPASSGIAIPLQRLPSRKKR